MVVKAFGTLFYLNTSWVWTENDIGRILICRMTNLHWFRSVRSDYWRAGCCVADLVCRSFEMHWMRKNLLCAKRIGVLLLPCCWFLSVLLFHLRSLSKMSPSLYLASCLCWLVCWLYTFLISSGLLLLFLFVVLVVSFFWVYKFGITLADIFLLAVMFTAICVQKFCASSAVDANMKLNFWGSMYVVRSCMLPLVLCSYLLFSVMYISDSSAKLPNVLLTLVM